MQKKTQQRIVTLVWQSGDYEAANQICHELCGEEMAAGNHSFMPYENLPQGIGTQDIGEVRINTEEGVWVLPNGGNPATDWRLVWMFEPLLAPQIE